MARYIDADKCNSYFFEHLDDQHMEIAMIAINEMPTEDVAPVTHAHWVKNPRWVEWSCTNCNAVQQRCTRYCGWCGAKMDAIK